MFVIDESYNPIFLRDNVILTKKGKNRRYELDTNQYEIILKLYKGIYLTKEEEVRLKNFSVDIEFLKQKEKKGMFINTIYEKTSQYYDLILDCESALEILSYKRVMVIGIGGVGTVLINHLISIGIQNFVLIDFDNVHISNLNRQYVFSLNDCGNSKIEIMKKYIKDRVPNACVEIFKKRINQHEDVTSILDSVGSINLIINAADMPVFEIQSVIIRACLERKISYANCGVGLYDGAWYIIDKNNCSLLSNMINKYNNVLNNIVYCKPIRSSLGITNSIITDLFSLDIFYFLIEKFDLVKAFNRVAIYNWNKSKMKYKRLKGTI